MTNYLTDGAPLRVLRMHEQTGTGLHGHEFHELVVVFSGRGIHFTDGEEYDISSGDVFLVLPGIGHGYRDTRRLDLVNILYLPERLNMPVADLRNIPGYQAFFELEPKMRARQCFKGKLTLDPGSLRTVKAMVNEISNELSGGLPGRHFTAIALFMQIFSIVARSYSKIQSVEGRAMLGIADLISHVDKHYAEHVSLKQLAKFAGMSRSTLHRNFRAALGVSPVRYVIQTRISKAAEMLCDPRTNVTEAAFKVGFKDSNYFVRQFRSQLGMTPGVFRRQHVVK